MPGRAGKIRPMSGPVWKRLRAKGTCDSCGETSDTLLAVGTVADFAFRPDSKFCPACYERYRGRHDELDPKAVAEQKLPPVISRPISEGDLPQ